MIIAQYWLNPYAKQANISDPYGLCKWVEAKTKGPTIEGVLYVFLPANV